jgi:hypothetical protein
MAVEYLNSRKNLDDTANHLMNVPTTHGSTGHPLKILLSAIGVTATEPKDDSPKPRV